MSTRPKVSLGIWAFGPMVTRFVPAGYKPEITEESMPEKVHRAVSGIGDLVDDYEFHYPGEINRDNLDDLRQALDGHGIYAVCAGLHVDPRFGKGGLSSVDDATRAEALRLTLEGVDLAGEIGAHYILCPGSRATTTPSRRRTASAGRGSPTRSGRRRTGRARTASSSSSSTRTPSRP